MILILVSVQLQLKKKKIPITWRLEIVVLINVFPETNRKIVDHISDVNSTYSDITRKYLLNEGLLADRIIKTGSPMFEVLNKYNKEINSSKILFDLKLKKENYFLISAHREENIDSANFTKFVEVLNSIAEKYKLPIIVSTHPRTRKKINSSGVEFHPFIRLMKPLGFFDYNNLQINANCIV